VTDAVLPGQSGPNLARQIEADRPSLRVLFISGYSDDAILRLGLLNDQEAFLQSRSARAFSSTRCSRSCGARTQVKVLVVEDDRSIAGFIAGGLRQEGYAVDVAEDGVSGLELARLGPYDAAVVDVMLPRLDGLSLVTALRHAGIATPVLFLSARHSVDDRVKGLQTGGDDYLAKPFAFAELVARVRALGRRSMAAVPPVLERSGIRLDPHHRETYRDDRYISLSRREFAVLEELLRAGGAVVSAETLLEKVWDEHMDPFTTIVRVTISGLRRKLGEPQLIETVTAVGYRIR
jgi:DNA-binding response OmpR family regulator